MTNIYKVLILDPIGSDGVQQLELLDEFEVHIKTSLSSEELMKIIPDYEIIIVRSRTQITAELIRSAKKLMIIGRAGVGLDNINLEEAKKSGIQVVNVSRGNAISVAEHTFAMMLSLTKHVPLATQLLKAGVWCKKQFKGRELFQRTLGIIGYGRIGRKVAQLAVAFRMEVIIYDPFLPESYTPPEDAIFVDFKTLLEESDFITLHVPLSNQTKYMIGSKELKSCKRGVFIINAARGGLINEDALIEAINSGHVGGVALDVFEHEPNINMPLICLPQVIATPHIAANTTEAQNFVSSRLIEKIESALSMISNNEGL